MRSGKNSINFCKNGFNLCKNGFSFCKDSIGLLQVWRSVLPPLSMTMTMMVMFIFRFLFFSALKSCNFLIIRVYLLNKIIYIYIRCIYI